jgi:hypothetical protein
LVGTTLDRRRPSRAGKTLLVERAASPKLSPVGRSPARDLRMRIRGQTTSFPSCTRTAWG